MQYVRQLRRKSTPNVLHSRFRVWGDAKKVIAMPCQMYKVVHNPGKESGSKDDASGLCYASGSASPRQPESDGKSNQCGTDN